MLKRFERKDRRKARIRAKISGTPECPRLAVFTSNQHMIAQLIDDTSGKTLAYADDLKIAEKLTKSQKAAKVG
jgi:large subunit ribosomal protein L18